MRSRILNRQVYVGLGVTAGVVASALGVARCTCSGGSGAPDQNLAGLVVEPVAEDRVVDVEAAARDPEVLAGALATPHRLLAAEIGAHRFAGSSRVRMIEDGAEIELLEDTTAIEVAGDGDFVARLENSRDYGREALFVDGELYLRPRYGKYHRRPPTTDDEPLGIRDDVFATLGAYFEVAASGAQIADAGATSYEGRAARKLQLSIAETPAKPDRPAAEQRSWRGDVAVTKLEGEVVIDAETAAPLAGSLDAAVQFVRDGRTLIMELHAKHAVTDIGSGDIVVEAPPDEEAVATPLRQHEVIERDRLLEGLAPPARAKRAGGTK